MGHEGHDDLLNNLDRAVDGLELYLPGTEPSFNETPVAQMRRHRRPLDDNGAKTVTLTEVDGVLRWEEGPVIAGRRARRGSRRFLGGGAPGEVVTQLKFEKLGLSEVSGFLEDLDKKLLGKDLKKQPSLCRWDENAGKLIDVNDGLKATKSTERALLFIHGTFSNSANIFDQLTGAPKGQDFLGRAAKHYDEVLAFDHHTLSISPTLNALDLSRLFVGCQAQVDVVAHSRGGLVARWWLEGFSRQAQAQSKAVLVGSPLYGTSLASPPKLRNAIDFITNVGHALSAVGGLASTALPFLTVGVGLVKVVTSITGLGAKLPLIDAVVAMIPGLAAQSRVDNNFEINRLRQQIGKSPDYYAVISNFEPADVGWAFWKRLGDWRDRLKDRAADLVFEDENDLVVDSKSMIDIFDAVKIQNVHDFKTTNQVHHTNYFQQPETLDFIVQSLKIP
jgi:pimeloyl-ACP methyl ester carboxylesterase